MLISLHDADKTQPPDTDLDDWFGSYHFQSRKVSADFRTAVQAVCPSAFTRTADADFFVRLLQYLMFPSLFQQGTTRIVVPCRTLAVLDGVTWTSNYRAIDRLQLFEARMGIPLNIEHWDYRRGLARTVQPQWPAALVTARDEELARFGQRRSRVYFDSGEPHGRSRRTQQERLEFANLRREIALSLPEDHPQHAVLELLNRPSERALKKTITRNIEAACQYVRAMPTATVSERQSKEWTMAVLDAVSLDCGMVYRHGHKTARFFAIGLTLHLLPRDVRKLLLSGCVTLDLKAAQLAIAARVWNVPQLRERLDQGNHWMMLQNELSLNAEQKPAMKTATYALLFGKSHHGRGRQDEVSGVIHDLAIDLGGDKAAGEISRRFGQHPVTQCLVEARKQRMAQVAHEGGLTTVFGKRVSVPSSETVKVGSAAYHKEMRSALAQELQAYEQKLMMPALEVVAARSGVTVVSYLHDGLTLHFEESSRAPAIIARMIKSVSKEALRLGVQTSLQEE